MIHVTNLIDVPPKMLQRLVRLATPTGTGTVDLTLFPFRGQEFRAEVWPAGIGRRFVEIAINVTRVWPYYQRHSAEQIGQGYRPWGWLFGPDELVLACVAHELRHVWQHRRKRPLCETDADTWALSRLARHRQ